MNPLLEYCGLPPEWHFRVGDGLHENHDFFHPGHFAEPIYWDLIWDIEERAIAAGVHEDGDAFYEMFESEDPDLICLDPLIGSTVVALVRAGAMPVSSCCGSEGHAENYPLVAFWCPAKRLPLIQRIAAVSGVSLDSFDGKYPGLVVYHEDDIHVMRKFAQKLAKRTAGVRRPPKPIRARGAGQQWSVDELIVTFDFYRRAGAVPIHHPELNEIAGLLRRSPAAVRRRLLQFASLDSENPCKGLAGAGREVQQCWDAFHDCRIGLEDAAEQSWECFT